MAARESFTGSTVKCENGLRISAGLVFMIGVLTLGLGALAGGQIWANTGSLPWGWVGGIASACLVALAWRAFFNRAASARSVRFLGEMAHGPLDESEFVETREGDETKAKLERDVELRPDKVADSIRAMLVRDAGGGGGDKRG